MHDSSAHSTKQNLSALVLGAIGVVYGDIGTSPLYALKECFSPAHGIPLSTASVLGILSLLFWTLIVVVSIKYVVFIMRADNNGEGGILALMALALRGARRERSRWLIVALGIFGAAMFYGDGMITPAISVLSAVEGLEIASPALSHYVVPISILILVGLFLIQQHGTATVGKLFGPVTCVWFVVLAGMGLYHIGRAPQILAALSPHYAIDFALTYKSKAFVVLGSVFLAVTGAEALYADMGHFGSRSIRIAWFGLVMPSLVLNYFGQGAMILLDPKAVDNPFFLMAPAWGVLPLVLLATCATVIASQAVISGAFSLTNQAVQLGYSPRVRIEHTSDREIGQIYVPGVNWMLLGAIILLVLSFKESSALANAYGIAVTSTMVITTILAYVVMRRIWKWHVALVTIGIALLMMVDLAFLAANALKILEGGWLPLAIGAVVFLLMTTWKRGREILFKRLQDDAMPMDLFLQAVAPNPPMQASGTAVFMTGNKTGVPHALLHNLKHNKVLHERNVLLTISTEDIPYVPDIDRLRVEPLGHGFWRVEAIYGFKEEPDVNAILDGCAEYHHLSFDMMETSFFLTRETLVATKAPGMAQWRERLFAWMAKNATKATDFFRIPTNRVVELGTVVEL